MTDHGSREGSHVPLEKAVERLTGAPPLAIDARHFMTGGSGRVGTGRTGFQLEVRGADRLRDPSGRPPEVGGLPAPTVTPGTIVLQRGPRCLA
ncbi:MAG TPA: hypothetical protein VE196_01440, partial [Pseudonocardiaceae bacterium]|nr:hypothetical protein [Pseudonocardiaceae bacterium]